MMRVATVPFLAFLTISCQARQLPPLAFTRVTVIDASQGTVQPDMTVIVRGKQIETVGKEGGVEIPTDARVVEAEGQFMIPGLWDLHTHMDDPEMWYLEPASEEKEKFLPLLIANGVTGVREPGGELSLLQGWRERINRGELLGPHIITSGPLVDGPEPMWPGSIAVTTEEEARRAVVSLKEQGADFIKIYSLLPRDAFFALADEARRERIPFIGHVPREVTVIEASDAGMACQEHLIGILDLAADPEEMEELTANIDPALPGWKRFVLRAQAWIEAYDEERASELFAHLAKNGTWQVPTMEVWWENAHYEEERDGERVTELSAYLPPHVREHWKPENNPHLQNRDPELVVARKELAKKNLELVGAMHRAGIQMMPGTDIGGNVHLFPGFSLHKELALFVEVGLTPAEALKTATYNPPKFFGLLDSRGSIEDGKVADLVLLEANPLEDIGNTKKIAGVVVQGSYFSRADLDGLLEKAKGSPASE